MNKQFTGTGIIALIAVLLTTGAIAFELTTRTCTELFFDPFPSLITKVLVCSVPVSLLTALHILKSSYSKVRDRVALICIGCALSVSASYTLLFVPTVHFCVLGLIVGIGALGLSPYIALIAALLLLRQWYVFSKVIEIDDDDPLMAEQLLMQRRQSSRWIWVGVPLAVVMLFWCSIVGGVAERMLTAATPAMKYGGLMLLRYGLSKKSVEALCAENRQENLGWSWYTPVFAQQEVLRDAYRYLYGPPEQIGKNRRNRTTPSFVFDRNFGSDRVGEVIPGLELLVSSIDMTVTEADLVGYSQWTMTINNRNPWQTEARALLRLPPYGVVSMVSLWIDGKECPAAFGATSTVRDAYTKVVSVRRDPLLVTFVSPDLVLLQCFPVPSRGTMKIRIGISAPLLSGGIARLPSLQYRNFDIPEKLRHDVAVAGSGSIILHGVDKNETDHAFVVRLEDAALCNPSLWLECTGAAHRQPVQMHTVIQQRPVLVIDGVREAAAIDWDVAMKTRSFSAVYCAKPYDFALWDGKQPLDRFVKKHAGYASVNSATALAEAAKKSVPVIWVHGITTGKGLFEPKEVFRCGKAGRVIGCPLDGGARGFPFDGEMNRYVVECPVSGSFGRDLEQALYMSRGAGEAGREDVAFFPAGGRYASGILLPADRALPGTHLYRLLIHSQVMRTWYEHRDIPDRLLQRAVAARIVTPVTGAVVLENRSQYEAHGLDPDAGTNTAVCVAEPELFLMLALGLCVVAMARRMDMKREDRFCVNG